MCGRYVSPDESAIEREFNLVRTEWQFPPSFNVAPTQSVPIVRTVEGTRRGALMRWGLIPEWWKQEANKVGATFNARGEEVASKPMFRASFLYAHSAFHRSPHTPRSSVLVAAPSPILPAPARSSDRLPPADHSETTQQTRSCSSTC